jgi:hypothetical protein
VIIKSPHTQPRPFNERVEFYDSADATVPLSPNLKKPGHT